VISEGTTLTQTRVIPGGVGSPASATNEVTQVSAERFTDPLDGERKILRFKHTIGYITAQPNDGFNCSGGCGVAGTSVVQ